MQEGDHDRDGADHLPQEGPIDIDAEVGRRVRLRRVMIGLTQLQVGQLCGISPQQIHKYEIGASRLTSNRLWQLASVLDVDISWFFGQEPAAGNLPDDFLAMLSDHANLEILVAAHSIASSKRKAQLVKIAQLFADEGDERGLALPEPEVMEPSLRVIRGR